MIRLPLCGTSSVVSCTVETKFVQCFLVGGRIGEAVGPSYCSVLTSRSCGRQVVVITPKYRSTFEHGKRVTSGLEVMCHIFLFPTCSTCSTFADMPNVVEVLNESEIYLSHNQELRNDRSQLAVLTELWQ